MSEPARIGTCRSATALVRVKRGSTWISFAPFSFAFMGQRNATGWHSAMFEPMITKQSVCSRLRGYRVAAPLYPRSEEHTSELQSQSNLVCRLLLEKKKKKKSN